ncbi:Fc receptor-like protein 5 isoform X2 [Gambusia affinis]|uniref:Fc receptor-like protein 5 isoform X2 n=1 Tax=Gambusia affinis TaxID=33528 RepID=UPI001CDD5C78|nr:Fc receptor-like protein 5 isoform X2 [Gambusia affinis]
MLLNSDFVGFTSNKISICVLVLSFLLCCGKPPVRRSGDKNLQSTAPKPVLTVSPSWPSPGTSVTLNCEIKPSSAGWRFYWYKVVPDLSKKNYRYEVLPDAINGPANNSIIIRGQKHTAGFACRAESGIPENLTDYSEPKFVWSADSHPAASLTVSPEREQLFTIDEIKVNCKGRSADWRVKRLTDQYYQSDLSDCSNWGTMTGSTCTFISPQYHRAVYWCESGSGEFSNAVNITVNTLESILTVSPSWPSPGASVTLSCEVKPSSTGWRFYWYKVVPDLSQNNYRYELLPGSINGTVENSFIITGQKHTAGFACRAGRGNPEIFSDYSEPNFIWSADSHPAASLSVSPDREQHFTTESLTLNCGGNSTEWRVKEFRGLSLSSFPGVCSRPSRPGFSCTFSKQQSDKSVYWCESGSGEFSNAVNITFAYRGLLLVSPVHPVTEGASVTLSCRMRGENKLSNVFFYHNDKLIQNDSRGELKISAVSQSDEGFYKCKYSGRVSPQSWMAVKAGSSSFPVMLVVGPVIGVVLLILLLLLCRFRQTKGSGRVETVYQDDQQQPVYSSLLQGDLCVYETIRQPGNCVNVSGQEQSDYANVGGRSNSA